MGVKGIESRRSSEGREYTVIRSPRRSSGIERLARVRRCHASSSIRNAIKIKDFHSVYLYLQLREIE
jgi:hypothetical protein